VRYTIKTPLENWQTWRMLACYIGHWKIRGYGPYAVIEKNEGELVVPLGFGFPESGLNPS
jgi:hypothetical protein